MPRDEEDDIINEDEDTDKDDAEDEDADDAEDEPKPDPMDEIKAKLDAMTAKLNEKKDPEPEPVPVDKNHGFEPEKIVNAGAQLGANAMLALRRAEGDLRKKFGSDLPDETYDEIVNQLAGLPPETLIDMVKKESHVAMGFAHYGSLVKDGKVKPGDKPKRAPTPVGGESPREGGEGAAGLAEFERLYGKVTSKSQRERLLKMGEKIG